MDSKPSQIRESEDKIRLQIELEFVQCFANPNYLNYLAQRGYFKDKSFINYLDYLQYWKRPEYAKFIKYPMALHFLDLLQHDNFRRELSSAQCAKFIDDQIILHWHHYARKRTKLFQNIQQKMNQQQPQSTTQVTNGTTTASSVGQQTSAGTNSTSNSVPITNSNGIVNGHANLK